MLKTSGYIVSSVSVVLLGLVSWPSASSNPKTMAFLLIGMGLSILGMLLRWFEYREEKRQKMQGDA